MMTRILRVLKHPWSACFIFKVSDTNPLEQQNETVEIMFFIQGLTVSQIKNVRTLIDGNIAKCNEEVVKVDTAEEWETIWSWKSSAWISSC